LSEKYQAAYKQHHSTDTVLLRVADDILRCVDSRKAVVLVLLDLSAAFDTVDYNVLLDRLSQRIGVSVLSHAWFRSYLSDRRQAVQIDSEVSEALHLDFGVPQGSVLGSLLVYLSFDYKNDPSACVHTV
jgi:hypothetical protein